MPALGRAVPAHRMRTASQLHENSQGSPWYAACSVWAVMESALFGTYVRRHLRGDDDRPALQPAMTPDQERRLVLYKGTPEECRQALEEHGDWVTRVLEGVALLTTKNELDCWKNK